jgi:hypothetical protein
VWEDQPHPQVESITFQNVNRLTGELDVEGFLPDVDVVATINLYDSYSISEDTTITVDLSCRAQPLAEPEKTIRLYLIMDGERRRSQTTTVVPYNNDPNITVTRVEPNPAWGGTAQGFNPLEWQHCQGSNVTDDAQSYNDVIYEITITGMEYSNTMKPVVTVTHNAINPDPINSPSNVYYFRQNSANPISMFVLKSLDEGGEFFHIGSTYAFSTTMNLPITTTQETVSGNVYTTFGIDLWYRTQEDFSNYVENPNSFANSNGDWPNYKSEQDRKRTIFMHQTEINYVRTRGSVTRYINDVDVKFENEGPFKNMPANGLNEGTRNSIKIAGEIGAQFTATLKELGETLVDITQPDGISTTALPLNISNVDYFGGEENIVATVEPAISAADDLSLDVYEIPDKGFIEFKLPNISAYTGTGYRTFELDVESYGTSSISSRANQTDGGTIQNADTLNSVLKSLYYQLPNVYIELTAIKDSGWLYTADGYDPTYLGSGGSTYIDRITGANSNISTRYGSPGGLISDLPYVVSLDKNTQIAKEVNSSPTIEWRVKVVGGSGDFSFTNEVKEILDSKGVGIGKYAFDSALIEPVLEGNNDIVNFSNVAVYIGEGTNDTSGDKTQFATIRFDYNPQRFGRLPQRYVLDLTKILQYT